MLNNILVGSIDVDAEWSGFMSLLDELMRRAFARVVDFEVSEAEAGVVAANSVPCHADHLHEHFHEHLDIRIVHVPLAPPSQLVRCDKAWTQASSRSLGTMT